MNNTVVIFLDSVEKVNQVVESSMVVQNLHPLDHPAKKVIISNAPLFISNSILEKELT